MTSSLPGAERLIGPERSCRQRLDGPFFDSPLEAVSWFGAVQAQHFAGASWAIGQRCADLDEAGFRQAFDDGAILRTHVLRPTWHLVAPADLRWMLALSAPQVHATSDFYYRKAGLDGATFQRCADVIVEALEAGDYRTRKELAAALADRGIQADGNRLAYIVMWCELEAIICSGPIRGRQHTYALVNERVPAVPNRSLDWGLAELARRYFTSHGPAQLRDFAWWAGLRITAARKGVKTAGSDIKERQIDGQRYFTGAEPSAPPVVPDGVHLLPNYDELVVAYQDRSALFGAAIGAGPGGMDALTNNLVVKAGRVIGTWKPTAGAKQVEVRVSLNAGTPDPGPALREGAESYGRFLGLPVLLTVS